MDVHFLLAKSLGYLQTLSFNLVRLVDGELAAAFLSFSNVTFNRIEDIYGDFSPSEGCTLVSLILRRSLLELGLIRYRVYTDQER